MAVKENCFSRGFVLAPYPRRGRETVSGHSEISCLAYILFQTVFHCIGAYNDAIQSHGKWLQKSVQAASFEHFGPVAQGLERATHNFQNRLVLLCNYLELQGLTKNFNPLKMTSLDRFGLLFSHAGYNTGYNGNFPRNMGIRSISPLASKPNGLQIKGEPMSTISGSESVRLESAKMVTLAA